MPVEFSRYPVWSGSVAIRGIDYMRPLQMFDVLVHLKKKRGGQRYHISESLSVGMHYTNYCKYRPFTTNITNAVLLITLNDVQIKTFPGMT